MPNRKDLLWFLAVVLASQIGFQIGCFYGSFCDPVAAIHDTQNVPPSTGVPPHTPRVGEKVMAKWGRAYYKATVKSVSNTGDEMAVQYEDDNSIETLPTKNVRPATGLLGTNTADYSYGVSRVDKADFLATYDYGTVSLRGNPLGSREAIILHTISSLPENITAALAAANNNGGLPPRLDVGEATRNCDVLNVVTLSSRSSNREATCTAIVSENDSAHIARWMRTSQGPSKIKKIDHELPLRPVAAGDRDGDKNDFPAPGLEYQEKALEFLKRYMASLTDILSSLRPILENIAKDNTVVTLVTNAGHSDLLMNFVCSAKSNGIDLSNVLVFATDQVAHDVAKGIGLESIYAQSIFKGTPENDAEDYGDEDYAEMMVAKVIPVYIANMLGFDVLFQDVDLIWRKDPIAFFRDKASDLQHFDMIFQDDGNRSLRFAPYSANTGFYFVRYNQRTQFLLTNLMHSYLSMILETRSHQQVLTALLAEHSSLTGLRVKTLVRDDFPTGYQYHESKKVMQQITKGTLEWYVFHMNWTGNKAEKIRFFQQMGWWYLDEMCANIDLLSKLSRQERLDRSSQCCSVPKISCHYSDMPSVIPCKGSPLYYNEDNE